MEKTIKYEDLFQHYLELIQWTDQDGELTTWQPFEDYPDESINEIVSSFATHTEALLKEFGIKVIH